ncbi:MAG: glycosyltransferase family 4 protein [Patescibacteria group bacterium]
MKILIATGLYPPDIGGPATILRALAKSLQEHGFGVKIITYSAVKNSADEKGFVYRIAKNRFYSRWHYLAKMFFLASQADLVYATDTYSVGYFAWLLNKFFGKKYIVRFAGDSAWETATAMGWTYDYIMDFQDRQYDEKIEKLKLRRQKILLAAEKVIAVSNFIAQLAKKIGVSDGKIKVIYNSVDFISEESLDEQAAGRIRQQYPASEKIIISAARLVPWKGMSGLIKILPQIIKQLGPTRLLILGAGAELENLKELAQSLKIADQVEFLGVIDHHQIINYFRAADLFILNTNYEGLSHTLLEAMRAEVPIISTNVGGNPEVIESGVSGWLVTYNDLPALQTATIKILSTHDLAKKFTMQAKAKLADFNWDSTIKQTVELISQIKNV